MSKNSPVVFDVPIEDPREIIPLDTAGLMTVDDAVRTYRLMVEFVRRVLTEGTDYGTIPGTGQKPTMYKPGAEKTRRFFNLSTKTKRVLYDEEWAVPVSEREFPLFSYTYETEVYGPDGVLVATCEGNANSYETKYRWRWVQTPPAHFDETLLLSEPGSETEFDFAIEKAETTGKYGKPEEYWNQWKQDIGDGTATQISRKTRAGKELKAWQRDGSKYRVPNENIFDQVNTLMKMAQKRSFVGAILLATGASEFFTQDLEDLSQHLGTEERTIRMYVPDKDDAARKLMNYVRGRGEQEAGNFIKDTLENAGIVFSLETWSECLNAIDEALDASVPQ